MPRLRAPRVAFGDTLSVVDHLDELRTRIIVCVCVLVVATGLCFWQGPLLIEIANVPLPGDREPITLGVTEPFFTTVKLALYAALLLSLPILLYQAYAFALPALRPGERRLITPLLISVPILFVAGAVFAYFVVMPAALKFLLGFNAGAFDIEVRASEYYGFFSLTLIAVGLLFQIPVVTLAVTRLGLVTPEQLGSNRRYAVLAIVVAAMLLPGTDPVTMLLAMAPLYGLFELSLLLARAFRPPDGARGRAAFESAP